MGLPDDKVPAEGAWARCPKCQERFYVRPPGRPSPLDLPDERPARPAGAGRRDPESQRLIDRLRAKSGRPADDPPEFDPGALILYPEALGWPRVQAAAPWILLALPLVLIIGFFYSLGNRENPPPPPPQKAMERMRDDMRPEVIRNDLLSIKRHLMRLKRVQIMNVGHKGPESRVFEYFRNLLVPGVCLDDIDNIAIEAPYPNAGFTATGTCRGRSLGKELIMSVRWPEVSAIVTFPDYPDQGWAELEMYPRPASSSPDDSDED